MNHASPGPSSATTHRRSGRRVARRLLLAGGAGLLVTAGTACGPLKIGDPAPFTPPPEGIDDLYRRDLLQAIDRALTAAGTPGALVAADPDLAASIPASLAEQRSALLTGAEAEDAASREAEGTSAASDGGGESGDSAAPDAQESAALVTALVSLRDLTAQAARQVSGSLSRPVVAIGAWCAWSSRRVALLVPSTADAWSPPPTAQEITPAREVPAADPPTIGAPSDFESTIETAQVDEWYAGYVFEVLAARTSGEERERHLRARDRHRARAEALATIAEEQGAPVAQRSAVYPLPARLGDPGGIASVPTSIGKDLLVVHLALVGASPFEARPLPIAAALAEGHGLATRTRTLPALPSFEDE